MDVDPPLFVVVGVLAMTVTLSILTVASLSLVSAISKDLMAKEVKVKNTPGAPPHIWRGYVIEGDAAQELRRKLQLFVSWTLTCYFFIMALVVVVIANALFALKRIQKASREESSDASALNSDSAAPSTLPSDYTTSQDHAEGLFFDIWEATQSNLSSLIEYASLDYAVVHFVIVYCMFIALSCVDFKSRFLFCLERHWPRQ